MKYFSIDIETTGLNPKQHQIIEIVAVFDDLLNPHPLEVLSKIKILVHHKQMTVDPYCANIHTDIWRDLQHRAADAEHCKPYQALHELLGWMKCQYPDGLPEKVNVAGKNFGSFDLQFLRRLENTSNPIVLPWPHRFIDVGSLCVRADDERVPDLATCLERCGEEPSVPHRAVDDALDVVRCVRAKLASNKCR